MLRLDGDDIALVASTNHPSKVWTIHVLAFKWPQCNCPLVAQGIIYKHVMKIFKMFHPHIPDGAIVCKTNIFHGVHRDPTLDVHINFVDMFDQEVDVNEKLDDVVALETIDQEEAYTIFNLGELIDQVFKELKIVACDFSLLLKH